MCIVLHSSQACNVLQLGLAHALVHHMLAQLHTDEKM